MRWPRKAPGFLYLARLWGGGGGAGGRLGLVRCNFGPFCWRVVGGWVEVVARRAGFEPWWSPVLAGGGGGGR
jgi:hypothetical protein